MGSYIYEQTSKQFTVVCPPKGGLPADITAVTANEIKFYCKPYWDLWNGWAPYTAQEKAVAAIYRRKQTVCSKRTPNRWVVRNEGEGIRKVLYKWVDTAEPKILFTDDDTFGHDLVLIGGVIKEGGKWILKPKGETP